ncbi:helix-turn-helix domain-containing protein [Streptomyces qinglanensis]|uniref:helix-turn-helix domain-containing protein n=1 Tax=Streptomyces qinglanensis TaxID=943816 RepID=UPI001FD1D115|nr:helix-turn-helix transcriptional regulator [Streptomyces qinglanensis]
MQGRQRRAADLNPPVPHSFGEDVRRVRRARRLTQRQLGQVTGYSEGYVSKIEKGTVTPSVKFAEGCDRAFGTGGLFAESLRRLMEVDHPDWFAPFVELEKHASEICDYSTNLIFGGAQTREYAQALLRSGQPLDTPDQTAAKADLRLKRGTLHTGGHPPLLWLVLDEACLRREVGGSAVMHEQLQHLMSLAEYPAVTIQVLPFTSGAPPAESPFTLLRFPEPTAQRPVLYSEGQGIGRVIDSAERVAEGWKLLDRLRADALSPAQSFDLIHGVMGEHTR